MEAIIQADYIVKLTAEGGQNIGVIPGGVALKHLRVRSDNTIVKVADLTEFYVRKIDGAWHYHSRAFPGTQLIAMTWAERYRLTEEPPGTYRLLTMQEYADLEAAEAADIIDNQGLKGQMQDMVDNTSFADLETKVNTIFADHTAAQRAFLLQMARVVLFLAKKERT